PDDAGLAGGHRLVDAARRREPGAHDGVVRGRVPGPAAARHGRVRPRLLPPRGQAVPLVLSAARTRPRGVKDRPSVEGGGAVLDASRAGPPEGDEHPTERISARAWAQAAGSGRMTRCTRTAGPLSPAGTVSRPNLVPVTHRGRARTTPHEPGVTTTVAVKIRLKRMGKIRA